MWARRVWRRRPGAMGRRYGGALLRRHRWVAQLSRPGVPMVRLAAQPLHLCVAATPGQLFTVMRRAARRWASQRLSLSPRTARGHSCRPRNRGTGRSPGECRSRPGKTRRIEAPASVCLPIAAPPGVQPSPPRAQAPGARLRRSRQPRPRRPGGGRRLHAGCRPGWTRLHAQWIPVPARHGRRGTGRPLRRPPVAPSRAKSRSLSVGPRASPLGFSTRGSRTGTAAVGRGRRRRRA
jgi:hypothetical protein